MTIATDATRALRQLQVALEALGETGDLDGEVLRLPSLGVRVLIAEVELRNGGAIVVYDLRSLEATEPGMTILAVGYGDTPEKAFGEAAFQWTTGVFTVVRHWLAPSTHTCFVDDMHMLVRAHDPDEEYGWRVHFGPVLSRAIGPDQGSAPMPAEPTDIMRILFDEVHARAAHNTLFWIEAFAVRYGDGRIDSTCRLHNDDWLEGNAALNRWASTWRTPPGTMVTARQFLLFEPVSPSDLHDQKQLRRLLARDESRNVPWWKRLFRR